MQEFRVITELPIGNGRYVIVIGCAAGGRYVDIAILASFFDCFFGPCTRIDEVNGVVGLGQIQWDARKLSRGPTLQKQHMVVVETENKSRRSCSACAAIPTKVLLR